jgi:hypothetical protein
VSAPPIPNPLRDAALAYAAIGWHVIPIHHVRFGPAGTACSCPEGRNCPSQGKHPRIKDWVGAATVDPATVAEWWARWPQANVGIVSGAKSGIVVVDVDPDKGGFDSLGELCDEFGQFPETVEADTGGGGLHVVFEHPGRPIRGGAGLKCWLNRPGLDVRGDGGMFVVSPSNHTSANRYAWREGQSPHARAVAPMPDWLLRIHDEATRPAAQRAAPQTPAAPANDAADFWLGKALVKADTGNRNDTGYWLALQLRDARLSENVASAAMLRYQRKVTTAAEPYTETEALATLRSAFKDPPRDPARSFWNVRERINPPVGVRQAEPPEQVIEQPAAPSLTASAELAEFLEGVTAGRIYEIPLPWPSMTKLTQALLPGSITVVCGDPGVGKTFWVLECLQFWHANGFNAAVFFIEKDRKFHTRRLLAQLEERGDFVNIAWLKENPLAWRAALERHAGIIDSLGELISSAPTERVTMELLERWVRANCEAGKEILVIDPITAAFAGADRWLADDNFMLGVQRTLNRHGARLVLVTHPQKVRKAGTAPQPGDMGGGAAYSRFADTNVWLYRSAKPRKVILRVAHGGMAKQSSHLFAQLHKTREGRGAGLEIAMDFAHTLRFVEQGVVLKDANPDPMEFAAEQRGPRIAAPEMIQDPFAEDAA